MKKLINDPARVADDMVEGVVLADDRLILLADENVVARADHAALRDAGKVAIISGGGSGHEPAHAGYVGRGLLTAAVAGPVFTSPSVDAVLKAILSVGGPQGVLLIVKNYTGDKLNFGLAAEIARTHGVPVEIVIVGDDVALGDANAAVGRRGIAGTIFVHKVAGAAAEAGLSLAEVRDEAQAAADALASMGVGLSACTVPAAGRPGFDLGEAEVEFGLGIHGESGVRRGAIAPADIMVGELLDRIVTQGDFAGGDEVALLVNGLGGTPAIELSIAARAALTQLAARGIAVRAVMVGTFLSALEMAGCSLSLMRLDARRQERLFAVTDASAWTRPTIPAAALTRTGEAQAREASDLMGEAWPDAAQRALFETKIRAVVDRLIAEEPELTRLDSIVGDGDLGISLARGAQAVSAAWGELDFDRPAHALDQISRLLRRSLGGTSGPLYAVFVLRMAASLAQEKEIDGQDAWARAFRAGCEGMMRLGGADRGDRTMLDALLPAADALEAARGDYAATLAVMEEAARSGADATASMQPRRGRSTYLGDRTAGHADPGAVAVAIWLDSLKG